MIKYKVLSVSFSYPDDKFFEFFSPLFSDEEKEELALEYDRLFKDRISLYTVEYSAENEFQRVEGLSDIMGFYRAFGVEPEGDRPDSIAIELEFIHCLIFKELHAKENNELKEKEEKALRCLDAQKKFFTSHVLAPARKMSKAIIAHSTNKFYRETSEDLLNFLDMEEKILGVKN